MILMSAAKAGGHQDLELLSHELLALVPEQPLGLRVDQHHFAHVVHDDKRIGHGLDQLLDRDTVVPPSDAVFFQDIPFR